SEMTRRRSSTSVCGKAPSSTPIERRASPGAVRSAPKTRTTFTGIPSPVLLYATVPRRSKRNPRRKRAPFDRARCLRFDVVRGRARGDPRRVDVNDVEARLAVRLVPRLDRRPVLDLHELQDGA